MSQGSENINKNLCEAFREGCQKTFNAKFDSLSDKIDLVNEKVELINNKIDLLKNNEVLHLQTRLEEIRKEKRSPLSKKEWGVIISTVIFGIFSLINTIIQYFKV